MAMNSSLENRLGEISKGRQLSNGWLRSERLAIFLTSRCWSWVWRGPALVERPGGTGEL